MIGVVLGKKGVAAGIERMNLSVTRHIEHGGLDVLEVLLYGGLATPNSRARTIHLDRWSRKPCTKMHENVVTSEWKG